ncbi:MAG: hypothetical protein U0M15_09480 [Bacillota bacterium]|nr:hypothetical protein [Bacillota bacterium]
MNPQEPSFVPPNIPQQEKELFHTVFLNRICAILYGKGLIPYEATK